MDADNVEKKWLAIIGSRTPTEVQRSYITQLLQTLDPQSYAIVSGCAYGIDALALQYANQLGFETIGMLPWKNYNKDIQAYCTYVLEVDALEEPSRRKAYETVIEHHPAPKMLTQGARKLHARNYAIIRWASQVIAAPSSKPGGGGTGQGIRLAEALKIPVTLIKPDLQKEPILWEGLGPK